jgi:outer membrane receptor protein involved in Fe transport
MRIQCLPATILCCSTAICGSALAQSAPASPAVAAPSAPGQAPTVSTDQPVAGEIIVTAQKRAEKLQSVGLTVAAFSGATLANQRINNVQDLTKVVPGLAATPSPTGSPVYTLRGVGFFESSIAASPDVATYLDQSPLALPVFSALTAFDLERVEVLKGPQGTLFGSNATGGAINFVAAKPSDKLGAGMDLGYGRFNTVEVNGFLTGPLTQTLNARVAVKAVRGDDWQRSATRDDSLGKADTAAARVILDWHPSDRASFVLNVNGWRDRSDPEAPQLARQSTPADLQAPIGTVGPTGEVTAALPLLGIAPPPHNDRYADWSPSIRPYQNTRLFQSTLTANYNVTDGITLTSLTGYVRFHMNKGTALSGLPYQDVDNASDKGHATDFNQEVRLASSDAHARLRWVVGGNYERTHSYEIVDLRYPDASTGIQQGFTANTYDTRQNVRSVAGFGHVEYDIVPRLTLKAGVRYTDTRHSAVSGTYQVPGYVEPYAGALGFEQFVNIVFPSAYLPIFCPGATFVPVQPGGSISINPQTCQSGIFRDVLKEHNTSWSFGADYKPFAGLLLYANASKGYKAGAFPIASASSWAQYDAVKQESLIDYEAGFKATLAGGAATINGAAFYYDYRNKQLRGKVVDAVFGAIDHLVNIPRSTVKGAEIDVNVRPVRGLNLRVAATYLDSKIKEYDGIVGSTRQNGLAFPVFGSFKGVPLPFAPKIQVAASLDYGFQLSDAVRAFVGGNVSAQSHSYGAPEISPQDIADVRIKGYATLDLRAGISAHNDKWKLTFWGKNVTNTYYWTNSLRNYDTIVRYAGRPAEYGVTLGWRL